MTIRVITNTNNRLNSLISLFTNMSDRGVGKLTEDYYIVDTNRILSQKSSREAVLFNMIQRHNALKGFVYNCFIIREEDVKN